MIRVEKKTTVDGCVSFVKRLLEVVNHVFSIAYRSIRKKKKKRAREKMEERVLLDSVPPRMYVYVSGSRDSHHAI